MANFTPSSGVANGLGNWAVEFRRPSIITMFGQAYEYAGFLNYTKARPEYQGQLSEQNKFTYFFTSADGGRVYGSGFNEEGFRVSPRGLENVLTGETISVENLGSSDLTIDEPTELTNLSLDGTTTDISGSLNITASTDFGSNAKATAEKFGTGVIASTSAIAGAAPATPSNPGEAEFVNPAGLQFFKQNENLVTLPSADAEATIVHVVPENVTPLTGSNSVPYGYPTSSSSGLRYRSENYPEGKPENNYRSSRKSFKIIRSYGLGYLGQRSWRHWCC